MAFAAFNLLAAVVATFLAPLLGGFHRLAVDGGHARLKITPGLLPNIRAQAGQDFIPDAICDPGPIVVVNSLPGRELVGDHPPLATGAYQVEDRVDDLAQVGFARTPSW